MDSIETIRNLWEDLAEIEKILAWMEKSQEIHQIDIDILLNKSRALYTHVLNLSVGSIDQVETITPGFERVITSEPEFVSAPDPGKINEPAAEQITQPELIPEPFGEPIPEPLAAPQPEPLAAPEREPLPEPEPIPDLYAEPEWEPEAEPEWEPFTEPEPIPEPEPVTAREPIPAPEPTRASEPIPAPEPVPPTRPSQEFHTIQPPQSPQFSQPSQPSASADSSQFSQPSHHSQPSHSSYNSLPSQPPVNQQNTGPKFPPYEPPAPKSHKTPVKETISEISLFQRDNSLNEALGKQKPVHDIASSITDIPISDIWSAITINERFLFIRELFGNDPEGFKNTVTYLNSQNSWDSAKVFITERFNWDANNPVANDFLNVVRRRFLK